jgi:predicted metal-dependent hydrolase
LKTIKTEVIDFHGIPVTVAWSVPKRGITLRVKSPDGNVTVSAPLGVSVNEVVDLLSQRHEWIIRNRERILAQPHPVQPKYEDGESILMFGQPYTLRVIQSDTDYPGVGVKTDSIVMTVRKGTSFATRKRMLDEFRLLTLDFMISGLHEAYYKEMHCDPIPFRIMRRKSVWGTFNARNRSIIYNLALSQVDLTYLQYVVVHEMTHQYVRAHNKEFYDRVATFLPNWKELRAGLRKFAQGNVIF